MKTYITDILPKIQRFSKRLDDLTLLTNQHWIVIDEINTSKNVYYFKTNNELLISKNGIVEKGKWELLGNNSLLIDRKDESYLFKHGFLDENILALKIDTKEEYAFLLNENNSTVELNNATDIVNFLTKKYLKPECKSIELVDNRKRLTKTIKTRDGNLEIKTYLSNGYTTGDKVFLNGKPAPDERYKIGWFDYIRVINGELKL